MECHDKKTQEIFPKNETKTYLQATFYDFESYQDKTKKNEITELLKYENVYVPNSVSIGDTVQRCPRISATPSENSWFGSSWKSWRGVKEDSSCGKEESMPEDIELFAWKQWRVIVKWRDQVSVLGFNWSR